MVLMLLLSCRRCCRSAGKGDKIWLYGRGVAFDYEEKPEEVAVQVLEQVSKPPVVKVDRSNFLWTKFGEGFGIQDEVGKLLADGPVNIVSKGIKWKSKAAKACIMDNVLLSSGASVLAGLPGGTAMAVTTTSRCCSILCRGFKLSRT